MSLNCSQAAQVAQRQGNELWFYTVDIFQGGSLLNKTVDVSLIETRLMHWLNYRYNLHGWAEPGTVLTANGEPILVAADGLFLAQVPPSVERGIVLEAQGKDGKREIIRKFRNAGNPAAPASKPGRSGSPESK